jgi:hypothetical protein
LLEHPIICAKDTIILVWETNGQITIMDEIIYANTW